MEIIDTHLHIWDLDKFSLPWLDDEGEILNRTYLLEDYKKSLGENYQISKAVYVEVDSAQDQKDKENEYIIDVCNDPDKVIEGAIISGDLTQKEFKTKANISSGTMGKLINNESVTTNTICKICDYFQCLPEEIMEWIPDADYEDKQKAKAEVQAQIDELQKQLKKL